MSAWPTVLAAAAAGFALKLAGYVVPRHLLDGWYVSRLVALLPVALLAGLVVTQTVTGPAGALVLDARAVAVAVALVALALRAPFLVVVVLAAGVAAGLRALGWG
ncbi:MAG: AzlD domain-containing protein [Austwickia sp.]|nr:AzlD domain-containing protein [Actinomycetota bacterium]MCB1252571.1 AzlD domain-containing protein [Austwickia sp.]